MASLFIDPIVMACPEKDSTLEEFENYVDRLLAWKELQDSTWTEIFISQNTPQILLNYNKYPLWDDLNSIINLYNIDYIQAKDIVNLVDSFLNKFLIFEEHFSIKDFLFENKQINPPVTEFRDSNFEDALSEILSFMCLKSYLKSEPDDYQLLLSNFDTINTLNIQSNIFAIEFEDGSSLPFDLLLKGEFKCCNKYSELHSFLNIEYLWKRCKSLSDYKSIINFRALQIAKVSCLSKESIKKFKIGSNFIESFKGYNFDSNEKRIKILLDSLSEVLLDLNLASTHPLRTGSGGNNPQIERSDYKAWRKDIDYEYHLHYWKSGNEIILANVVVHNDFNISF